MRFRSWGALGAFAVLAALMLSVSASGADNSAAKRMYIVQMLEAPAVAYEGGTAGIPATKPGKGKKLDPDSVAVQKYVGHLKATHDQALAKVGGAKKVYDYGATYNGFAAELTAGQAEGLEKVEGVLAVTPDEIRQPDTSHTPSFLGIDQPGGLWSKLGGVGNAGEGIVIGVVDTGIWAEHPSFSDKPSEGGQEYGPIPQGWLKKDRCQPGEGFQNSDCNKKLIGAQFFYEGFGLDQIAERDFLSPRDYNGHGSHTASTAGGNNGIQATGDAAGFGKISGMAPRARIAAYKVCWEDAGDGGCANSDSMAAIDKAVADGVDVINFSISGTRTNFLDPVEVAFLFAADAGVYVAASAGNTNGASQVAHPSPWITTVAASSHGLGGTGTVTLGNGATYTGASLTRAVPSKPLIRSSAAGRAGANAESVRLCFNEDVLDPAKVSGKIIICDRGGNVLVDKAAAAHAAGAAGMILANTSVPASATTTLAILHIVPTVHVAAAAGDAIKAYLDANPATATASLSAAAISYGNPAPRMADFSSDGPLTAGRGDVLKPDVSAPGVDVLAAVAPPGNHGRLFDIISGTSMSSPHVAGLGAAMKQLHPDWSPMMIKSAFMTTGFDVPATTFGIFEFGGGHVRPNNAADPGLVFDHGFNDWLAFLKGQKLCCATSATIPSLDASDLNQASIAIGDLAGSQTVTRTAKSVGSQSETYQFSVTGLTGITATPSVMSFTAAPGSSTQFSVTFLRTTATLGTYQQGFITWTGSRGHVVRMPVVIRPVPIAAPAEVTGTGGPLTWTAKMGYDGTLNTVVRGPVPAVKSTFTLLQDPDATFDPAVATGTFKKDVVVSPGGIFRAGIYEDAITPTGTDLDLYVYSGASLVGISADGDSNEEVTLRYTGATPLTLTVYVHGWSTNGPSAQVTLFDWVANAATGAMSVVPATTTVTTGSTPSFTATFTGLAAATRYFGAVDYTDGTSTRIGQTYVSVKTP